MARPIPVAPLMSGNLSRKGIDSESGSGPRPREARRGAQDRPVGASCAIGIVRPLRARFHQIAALHRGHVFPKRYGHRARIELSTSL